MIQADKIFRVGKKHIRLNVKIYATPSNVRRALKDDNLRAMCICYEQAIQIIISKKGIVDGTLDHELTHVVQFSGIKAHEKQAELTEQVGPWIRGLL